MSKKSLTKRWRYLIVVLLGIVVFVTVIPSCAAISSSKFDALVNVSKTEQKSAVSESKSLESIIENLPSAEEIRAMPLAIHPRLLASEERFAEIKEQIKTDETMKRWYEKLHQDAEKFLKEEPPVYKLQDEIRMVDTSRLVLKRVTTLALIYRLSKDEPYLQRVWQELKAVSEFPNWNPSHFLDTAEMTHAFAIGYDWLYQYWNSQEKKLISSAIVKKGLKAALNAYHQKQKWTKTETNWNQVCNGSIGIGGLAVLDEYPAIASQALYNALARLPQAMQHYEPDGAFNEGTSYWHYASKYNALILDALNTAIGKDFGLSQISGFSKTGFFPIYMTGAFGVPFNFADSKERILQSPELFWMADKFDQPIYKLYQQQIAAPEALDLVWYKPSKNNSSFKQLPLDKYFRGLEVISMRSEWENPQGIFVGFKAGDNKANHSNLDLGTFVLDALGVRWAVELGNDDYNLPGYFNKKKQRWTYYRMRAEGQNTLVINPDKNPDQNPNSQANIIHFDSSRKKASAIADLTSAYSPNIRQLHREITLDRQRQKILIQDDIKAKIPIEAWWFMHTKADIKISKDKKTATLFQKGVQLKAKIANANNYEFEVMDARPLPTSPNPRGQRENSGVQKLAIHLKNILNEKLTIVFIPN